MVHLKIIRDDLQKEIQALVAEIQFSAVQEDTPWRLRTSCRFHQKLPLSIDIPDHPFLKPIYASMRDISIGGLCFESIHEFNVGQQLIITIETEYKHYRILSVVTHSNFKGPMFRTGVSFDLDEPA